METINQILIMAVLLLVGALCYKFKIITIEGNKSLSSLVVNVVNPAMIINSYQIGYTAERLHMLIYVFLLSLISFAIVIPLANLMNRHGEHKNVDRIASVYSNCGFIGIPIVNSIYGAEGVFYLTGYITAFNLLFWSHGVSVLENGFDKKNLKNIILSPAIISCIVGIALFLLQIKIINPFGKTIELIASMVTPLSLIVAGFSVAQIEFKKAIKKPAVFKVTFYKLIFLPLTVWLIFLLIPLPPILKNIVILGYACPVGTSAILVTSKAGKDESLITQYFAFTTVLSMLTLPLLQFLISKIN